MRVRSHSLLLLSSLLLTPLAQADWRCRLQTVVQRLLPPPHRPQPDAPFVVEDAVARLAPPGAPADVYTGFIEALYGINREHSGPDLLRLLLGESETGTRPGIAGSRLLYRYDVRRTLPDTPEPSFAWLGRRPQFDPVGRDPAGRNYRNTRAWVGRRRRPVSLEEFRSAHARFSAEGVEGVRNEGGFRGDGILVTMHPTPEELPILQANPYLTVGDSPAPRGTRLVNYPSAGHVSEAALARAERFDPRTVAAIRRERPVFSESRDRQLTERLVTALTRERFDWFTQETAGLTPVRTPNQYHAYVRAVSQLYLDILSIHPFENINGRTSRGYLLYHLLEREGFPAPRLRDIDRDIEMSVEEFALQVEEGVRESIRLYDGLAAARTEGRAWESVPEVFFPGLPADIPGPAFLEFARARLRTDASLRNRFHINPNEVQPDLIEAYRAAHPTPPLPPTP